MNTIADLLDAQALYVEAQGNYISAYGTFRLSISQYLNATGRLSSHPLFQPHADSEHQIPGIL